MEREIGFELRDVMQRIHQAMERNRLKDNNHLTHTQMMLLVYLSQQSEPVYQKHIEKRFNIRRSSATALLNVLEREQYIKRQEVAFDARLKQIVLTETSKAVIEIMDQNIRTLEDRLGQGISDQDRLIFFKVIDQIKENLE